jgi:hypothetical protein
VKKLLPFFLAIATAAAQPQPILFDLTGATPPLSGELPVFNATTEEFDFVGVQDVPTPWTAGSILFVDTGGKITQDNANLFWDNSNNRLGVNTNSPSHPLHVAGGNIRVDSDSGLYAPGSFGVLTFNNDLGIILRFLNWPFPSWSDGTTSNGFMQIGLNSGFFTGFAGSILTRLGFSSSGTTIANLDHSLLPVPTGLLHLETGTTGLDILNLQGVASQVADYLNITSSGATQGNIFKVDSTGILLVGPNGSFGLEGATADGFETLFSITDPTADRTVTFPDASGTVALDVPTLDSNTSVPTVTSVSNVATVADELQHYIRVGNVVHVVGIVRLTVTSPSTSTVFDVSTPITTNFTSTSAAIGVGTSDMPQDSEAVVTDVNGTSDVRVTFAADSDIGFHRIRFTYTYIIE